MLAEMTQAAEKAWREEIVRSCLVANSSPRTLVWEGYQFCIPGFATTVGGDNYVRTLKRTIRNQVQGSFSSTITPLPAKEMTELTGAAEAGAHGNR
jgi:hypothetical protein